MFEAHQRTQARALRIGVTRGDGALIGVGAANGAADGRERALPGLGQRLDAAARVVAEDIAASIAGAPPPAPYEASGVCYAEFGDGLVSKVEVNFLKGPAAAAQRHDPSREIAAEKEQFGATRRTRWFER